MIAEQRLMAWTRELDPGRYAAVMATGIVSIDASQHGMSALASALFVINAAAWIWLTSLSVLRAVRFRDALLADFYNPEVGAGFLTFVAGTCVLATQCVIVIDAHLAAFVLGGIGAVAWVVLTYAFFAAMVTRRIKHGLAHSINGSWLVVVVATQSVAIVAIVLSAGFVDIRIDDQVVLLFLGLCLYLLGGALYLLIITLVVYRMVFLPMRARDFKPPYWINMGALAITTLAGSLFVLYVPDPGTLAGLLPFVKGFTLFFWATASWWIPLLVLLEAWRHLRRHVPFRYAEDDWDIVFPIAMYTVGTYELAHALQLNFLLAIPAWGVYVSLLVWSIVALAWIVHLLRSGDVKRIARSRSG